MSIYDESLERGNLICANLIVLCGRRLVSCYSLVAVWLHACSMLVCSGGKLPHH